MRFPLKNPSDIHEIFLRYPSPRSPETKIGHPRGCPIFYLPIAFLLAVHSLHLTHRLGGSVSRERAPFLYNRCVFSMPLFRSQREKCRSSVCDGEKIVLRPREDCFEMERGSFSDGHSAFLVSGGNAGAQQVGEEIGEQDRQEREKDLEDDDIGEFSSRRCKIDVGEDRKDTCKSDGEAVDRTEEHREEDGDRIAVPFQGKQNSFFFACVSALMQTEEIGEDDAGGEEQQVDEQGGGEERKDGVDDGVAYGVSSAEEPVERHSDEVLDDKRSEKERDGDHGCAVFSATKQREREHKDGAIAEEMQVGEEVGKGFAENVILRL